MCTSKHPGLKPLDQHLRELGQKFFQKINKFEIFFDVHMDTSVIVNNIKKNFKFFHFTTKFFSWSANVQSDEKNFCCKIFSLLKK